MNQLSERGNIHYGKEGDIDKAEDNIILKSEPAESTNEKKNDTLVMMAHCVTEEEKRKDKSKRARIVRLEENHIHDDGQIENDKEGEDKKRLMAHVVVYSANTAPCARSFRTILTEDENHLHGNRTAA